jgi:hypothetical protein
VRKKIEQAIGRRAEADEGGARQPRQHAPSRSLGHLLADWSILNAEKLERKLEERAGTQTQSIGAAIAWRLFFRAVCF